MQKKYLFRLVILPVWLICGYAMTWAQVGFNPSYAILRFNGGSDAFYDLNASTGNPDFQGANLGFFTPGNSIVVRTAENNVYKCGSCDIWQTKVHYRVFKTGDTPPAFSEHTVGYTSGFGNGCGGADQRWSSANNMTNLLSGLDFGCYTFQIYTSLNYQFCGDGVVQNNNSGSYFSATFTYWAGTGELCNGIDDDCDGMTDEGLTFNTYYTDGDGDGYGAGAGTSLCADPGTGFAGNDQDCDDSNMAINPLASESCNLIDDDCDMNIDEGFPVNTYYQDADNDGRGNPDVDTTACTAPAGYVATPNDCNDASATNCPKTNSMTTTNITDNSALLSWTDLPCAVLYRVEYRRRSNPVEISWTVLYTPDPFLVLSGLSPDSTKYQWRVATICTPDLTAAESGYAAPVQYFATQFRAYPDADGDGFGDASAAFSLFTTFPLTGYAHNNTDCDDNNDSTYPEAPEICNGVDDDCDENTDEGVLLTFYLDSDGDGLGDQASSTLTCTAPEGYVGNSSDCDDSNETVTCPPPTDISVSSIGSTNVSIDWTGTYCASAYNIMYRYPSGSWSPPVTTEDASMYFEFLTPTTTYLARVRAKCPAPNPQLQSAWVYFTFTTDSGTQLQGELTENNEAAVYQKGFECTVYPNPGDGLFQLRIGSESEGVADIMVFDATGKSVYVVQKQLYEGLTIATIDLGILPEGFYQLQISRGTEMQSRKLAIIR